MGTASYVLAGAESGESLALSSACHGAGRSPSLRGVAEEAPGAYKSVERVMDVAERAGLATKVARLEPLICVKG
jgi:tRNA-splicing ligase RtcB